MNTTTVFEDIPVLGYETADEQIPQVSKNTCVDTHLFNYVPVSIEEWAVFTYDYVANIVCELQ